MKESIKDPLKLFNKLLNKTMPFLDNEVNISPEHLFYFSYITFMVVNFFFKFTTLKSFFGVDPDLLAKIIIYPLYALLFIKVICYQNYKKNEILKIVLIGTLIFISAYFSGVKLLLTAFIFIVAAKDIDINKVIKLTLFIQILCISIIVMLALSGVIENRIFTRRDGDIRYSLGFTHPNAFAGQILQLIIISVWIRWEKFNYKDYLILLLLGLFILKVCDSRTSSLLIFILIIMVAIYKYLEHKPIKRIDILNKAIYIGTQISIIMSSVVSIALGVLYDPNNKIYFLINKLLSGRIKLLHDYYINQGYSIIGQKIEIISTYASKKTALYDTTALDNAYGHIAVRYGIIILIVFVIGYYLVAKKAFKEKNIKALICIFIYILFGITEVYIFNLPYNVLFLLFAIAIYSDKKISN